MISRHRALLSCGALPQLLSLINRAVKAVKTVVWHFEGMAGKDIDPGEEYSGSGQVELWDCAFRALTSARSLGLHLVVRRCGLVHRGCSRAFARRRSCRRLEKLIHPTCVRGGAGAPSRRCCLNSEVKDLVGRSRDAITRP